MKHLLILLKNKMTYIGIITGAVAGFLYWKFVGCTSGTCPITSNKYISIAYGALLGTLLFSTFAGATTKNNILRNFFKSDTTASYSILSEEEMLTMTEDSNYIVIDVRTPSEWESGYISGTDMFIDYTSAEFEEEVLKLDTSKNYILYCRSGNRSGKASEIMFKNGFTNLYHLSGGIKNWNSELKTDK